MDKYKTVYVYDAHTKEFLNDLLIQENPKHPGQFLKPPPNTTDTAPPRSAAANEALRFNIQTKNWEYVADYRGKVFDKVTKDRQKYTKLGELPDNLTAKPPPADYLSKWDDAAQDWVRDEQAIQHQLDEQWKHEQLTLAAEHIERHQDSDPDALATEQEWREYRMQLRSYEPGASKRKTDEHHKRPVSPV